MSVQDRFESLWNDYLEGELDEHGMIELKRLLNADDRHLTNAVEDFQIHRLLGLNAQDTESRHEDFVRETMKRLPVAPGEFIGKVMHSIPYSSAPTKPSGIYTHWILSAAGALALAAAFLFFLSLRQRNVVEITGLSGRLQWTGNDGLVVHDLESGMKLPGGTLDGMTPNSWIELTFKDGSTVEMSGSAILTFSAIERKELRLKSGGISASVQPQRKGAPMRIHTRSALLEVLGTRFEVEAQSSATILNVTEGSVRVKRLNDGQTVDVPARHRLIASADHDLSPTPLPAFVHSWRSAIYKGPEGMHGKWFPWTESGDAKLKAIPYVTEHGRTIYAVAVPVSCGENSPVVLKSDSQIRVSGFLRNSSVVFFGVTLRRASGDFAGKFQIALPPENFPAGREFKVALPVRQWRLDPSLNHLREQLASNPFGLIVENIWSHSLYNQAGLEVAQFEIDAPNNAADP